MTVKTHSSSTDCLGFISDTTYIAFPKELVKEVTGGTIEEPYVYWQPEQQEVTSGNPGNHVLDANQFINVAAFDEGEILCDDTEQLEWNDDLTMLLIQTRLGMAKEFSEPKCSKCKLWKRVAARMNSLRGGETSLIGPDCDRKWRNLVQTFKTIRERLERTGRNSVTWKFYSLMAEAMLGQTNDVDGMAENTILHLEWTSGLVDTCDEGDAIDSELAWTDDLIKLLIEIRSTMAKHFIERRYSAYKLWRRVALKMNRIRGGQLPTITGPDCDRKWRNLLQTFNAIQVREGSAQGGGSWKFHSMMSDALKDNPVGEGEIVDRFGVKQNIWTPTLIRLLIETRSSMSKHFEMPKCCKSKLWRGIAMKINSLRSDGLPAFTGPDCDRKWRNLVQTFKTIRNRRQRSGLNCVNWKFYSLMLEALNDAEATDTSTSTGRGFGRFRKKDTESPEEAPDWFRRYVEERRVVEDQRWEELKRMENEKLDAIRALTETIKQHACKCGPKES